MAELHHECGIAAVYHLPTGETNSLTHAGNPEQTSRWIPKLLLEIQNRGQLAAGMTSYRPGKSQILSTYKDVGSVAEVFQLSKKAEFAARMANLDGMAAIGHVRYATCGKDDWNYAQPFDRQHLEKRKWFSFGYNGQLANYRELRDEITLNGEFHLSRDTDTEVVLHLLSQQFSGPNPPSLREAFANLSKRLDGAYNIVFLNARGEMVVARDPLGIRPLCIARRGPMFAAASESVALVNMGFLPTEVQSLPPGHAVIIQNGEIEIEQFASSPRRAHCFFEWIYFANVASTLDEESVYLVRKRLGEELADQENLVADKDTIIVPVPDTAKAAADSMAYKFGVPSLEGLIRNRYVGRTFIEGNDRAERAKQKYTPLPEVLEGKKVILVEDTIVRSTTMQTLIQQIRERGRAREIHVRVACPPIISPCFYGIDMSTVKELFASSFLGENLTITPEIEANMATHLKADSLRYLSMDALVRSLGRPAEDLCRACINREYPTAGGEKMYHLALDDRIGLDGQTYNRTYDSPRSAVPS